MSFDAVVHFEVASIQANLVGLLERSVNSLHQLSKLNVLELSSHMSKESTIFFFLDHVMFPGYFSRCTRWH